MKRGNRRPSHPGAVLRDIYLNELGVTITDFANDIGVSRKAVSGIVNGRKSVTPEMAVRFSKALGTTPDIWLNLQTAYDLWEAERSMEREIGAITPLRGLVEA